MDEQPTAPDTRAAPDRAEEMLGRLGQRFQDIRTNVGHALEQRAQRPTSTSSQATPGSVNERFGGWGERVGFMAGIAGLQMRRWGARAREEAEDLWAEAQHLRQQPHPGGAGHVPGNQHDAAEHGAERAPSAHERHARVADAEQRDASDQPS